jgi:hypothetical protein
LKRLFHLRFGILILGLAVVVLGSCKPPLFPPNVALSAAHSLTFDVNPSTNEITVSEHVISVDARISESGSYQWTINGSSPGNASVNVIESSSGSLKFHVPSDYSGGYEIAYLLTGEGGTGSASVSLSAIPMDYDPDTSVTEAANPGGTTAPLDVYFVYQNLSSRTAPNSISVNGSIAASDDLGISRSVTPITRPPADPLTVLPPPRAVTEFNNNPPLRTGGMSRSIFEWNPEPSASLVVGTSAFTFNVDGGGTVPATLRWQHSKGGKTVNVWVGDAWYAFATNPSNTTADFVAETDAYLQSGVTDSLIEIFAESFFSSADDNDIYTWVTTLIGEEWGPSGYSNLIGETNSIDILLYDIDGDWNVDDGKMIGYFWARDNFDSSFQEKSNERVMFYMDAPFLHYTDAFWNDSEGTLISTLAHEFQHMINFYQRAVLNDRYDGTWMNEMMSMMVEDLVAANINAELAADGFSISVDPPTDRLPYFLYFVDDSLTAWPGIYDVSSDYAISYAFGAYLLRNFGGPAFMNALMNAGGDDTGAVSAALSSYSEDIGSVMRHWAVAVLTSDGTDPGSPVTYYGNGAGESFGGETYLLSTINLSSIFQADPAGPPYESGPYIFSDPALYGPAIPPFASVYHRAASNVSTSREFTVEIPAGIAVTVVYN